MAKILSGALRATILVVASVALTGCQEEPPEVAEKIRAIKTITVAERGSGQMQRFPGLVEAVDTSVLSFEVPGNTREVEANVGDRVAQGQVLATLDPTPFELNVAAAEADVGRAKAVLAEKSNDFDRQNTLFKKDWVSKAALDQALAAKDSAVNEVSYATSKLNLARRDLEKTKLVAPFDGVIAEKHADPFQEVARGEKIFDIYIEGAMEVVISVPETQIGDIYQGLPADVAFPADKIQAIKGRVSEIGSSASEANAFPVKVALVDATPEVLPGMTAEASLLLGGEDDETTYLIPFAAIAPGEESGRGYVFVYDQATSTVARHPVSGAGVRDNRVLVSEGIAAGDIVAVAGVSFLRDGQKVKLLSE